MWRRNEYIINVNQCNMKGGNDANNDAILWL